MMSLSSVKLAAPSFERIRSFSGEYEENLIGSKNDAIANSDAGRDIFVKPVGLYTRLHSKV